MRKSISIFVVFFTLFSYNIQGQSASKLRKIGADFEANKVYDKAVTYYLKALKKRSNETKAIIGLERCATHVMEDKLSKITEAFAFKNYEQVLHNFNSAKDFQTELGSVGVIVNIPTSYKDKSERSKEFLAEKYYAQGQQNYNSGFYDSAIESYEKSQEYIYGYKDINNLLYQAKDAKNIEAAEKFYYSGMSKFESKNYRMAYYDFEKCLNYKRGYKNASELKEKALINGRVNVGVFKVANTSNYYKGIEETLYSEIISKIEQKRSPFIKIVDYNSLKNEVGSRYNFNNSNASRIGKTANLDYVLIPQLIEVSTSGGNTKSEDITAYELYYSKNSEGKSIPKGRKVTFKLHEASSSVNYKVKYDLINVKNDHVVASDIFSRSENDHVKYASYRGDPTKLCISDPGENGSSLLGSLLTNITMVDQKLFKSPKSLKSPYDLHQMAFDKMALEIANSVYNKISN